MKCTFSFLLIAMALMAEGKSFRLKRQNDAIIFPSDDTVPAIQLLQQQQEEQQPNRRETQSAPQNNLLEPTVSQLQTSQTTANSITTVRPQIQRKTTPTPEYLRCMKDCPTTMEYNPVCGTDQVQYHNHQRLLCANRCGANVQVIRRGNCRGLNFTN